MTIENEGYNVWVVVKKTQLLFYLPLSFERR
jgi:hypothetical protein